MRIHGLTSITLVSTVLMLAACPEEADDGDDELGETTSGTTTDDGDADGDTTTDDGDDDTTGDGDTGDTTGDGDTTDDTTDDDTTDTGNVNEACMGMVAPAGTLTVGQPVSHWGGGFTVEGDEWDYCEMGGTPFLLILSAGWCGPCHDLASGFAGQPSSWDPAVLAPVIAGMEAGTLGVVELVVDNFVDFDATSLADLQSWEMMHPNEHIRLLGDPTPGVNGEEVMWQYLAPSHMGGVPSGILVDADFNLEVIDLQGSINTAGSKYGG